MLRAAPENSADAPRACRQRAAAEGGETNDCGASRSSWRALNKGEFSSVVGGGFVELELGFGCVASSWLSLLSFPHHLICLRGGV